MTNYSERSVLELVCDLEGTNAAIAFLSQDGQDLPKLLQAKKAKYEQEVKEIRAELTSRL